MTLCCLAITRAPERERGTAVDLPNPEPEPEQQKGGAMSSITKESLGEIIRQGIETGSHPEVIANDILMYIKETILKSRKPKASADSGEGN